MSYLNEEKSLSEAAAEGWVRDYAWRYDPDERDYVLVQAGTANAEQVLKVWHGYWIRAFVPCHLIINPNTSYNGASAASMSATAARPASFESLDVPPPPPE